VFGRFRVAILRNVSVLLVVNKPGNIARAIALAAAVSRCVADVLLAVVNETGDALWLSGRISLRLGAFRIPGGARRSGLW
jgi:hypothetical protein